MPEYVLPLAAPSATLAEVGGKGANLAELARAGFAVPPGFLVGTAAYRVFVAANGIARQIVDLASAAPADDPPALDAASDQIRGLFARADMPAELAEPILAAYHSLAAARPGLAVAVRSSATAEDLPGLSFAGQQDTYLNIVGDDALLDAVRRCWASLWTARAMGYRARNGIAPGDVALAVVVQELVPSEVSGVLFTANPLTGRRAEIVIDASYGLGEAIVSGQVEPDHYVVDPQTWRVIGRKLGAKALAILPRAGGGTDQVARTGAGQALADAQILDLARTAARVAAHFGSPQDIEWAWAGGQLYILQSRPITSLYPLPQVPAAPGAARVYYSFNSVQGVVDPFTPLGCDLLQLLAGGFLSVARVGRAPREVIPAAGGRLFIDVTNLTRLAVAVFQRVDPGARQTLARLIAEGQVEARAPSIGTILRHLAPLLRTIVPRAIESLRAPEFGRARGLAEAEAFLDSARAHVAAARTLSALLDAAEQDVARAVPTVLPALGPVFAPSLLLMGLAGRMLERWLGQPRGAVFQLLRGLPHNGTTEMDLKLWATAQAIRADAPAREALLRMPVEAQASAYTRGALPPVAQRAIGEFLAQYGMRGVAEIDIGRPRWRDDPTPILQTIHGYLQLEDADLAPDRQFERGAAEAARLTDEWATRLARRPLGGPRARLLRFCVDRMRRLAGTREAPKFYLVNVLGLYRDALLAHGRDLAARGVLPQPADIFFLSIDQLRRYARGEAADLAALVAAARAEYEHDRAGRRMPRLLLGTGETFYDGMAAPGANDLVGDPVSPGVAEGPARVVTDPRGVRLAPGEILVCPATDPGWTPLFLTAGALVMEVGGMVTHGSVVAREYGIPAVVGVHNATTRLATGQRIRVDGMAGRVTILDAAPGEVRPAA